MQKIVIILCCILPITNAYSMQKTGPIRHSRGEISNTVFIALRSSDITIYMQKQERLFTDLIEKFKQAKARYQQTLSTASDTEKERINAILKKLQAQLSMVISIKWKAKAPTTNKNKEELEHAIANFNNSYFE